jgi:hypothetical protein
MKTLIRTVTVLGAAILLCACRFHLFQTPPPPLSWVLIPKMGSEPHGYYTYTYVIFGPPGEQADQKTAQAGRNRALLKAITQQTAPAGAAQAETPAQTNLFCFPASSGNPGREPGIDNYDPKLADVYRGNFDFRLRGGHRGRVLGMRLEKGLGPFLITISAPMGQTKDTAPLVVTELTAIDPAKMTEVVAAYRQKPGEDMEGDKSADDAQQFLQRLSEKLNKAGGNATFWIPGPWPTQHGAHPY